MYTKWHALAVVSALRVLHVSHLTLLVVMVYKAVSLNISADIKSPYISETVRDRLILLWNVNRKS